MSLVLLHRRMTLIQTKTWLLSFSLCESHCTALCLDPPKRVIAFGRYGTSNRFSSSLWNHRSTDTFLDLETILETHSLIHMKGNATSNHGWYASRYIHYHNVQFQPPHTILSARLNPYQMVATYPTKLINDEALCIHIKALFNCCISVEWGAGS